MFHKNVLPPSSGLKSKQSKQPTLLAACFFWLLGLPFNTEDEDSISKMLVKFYQALRRHIPSDTTLLIWSFWSAFTVLTKSRLMRLLCCLCVYRCNPQYCYWPMAQLVSNHTINTFLWQQIHAQQ
jgi:hypothetical protein